MLLSFMKSKIGRGHVTQAQLHYEGSITIDADLLKAVDILPGQQVDVLNLNNGVRFQTYVIAGRPGSGEICLNGPAARLGVIGDQVTILSYALLDSNEAKSFQPKVIHLDAHNKIKN